MNSIIGAGKVSTRFEQISEMLEKVHERYPDLKVRDVALVVDISVERDETGSQGGLLVSCSDDRFWVQEALFQRAAEVAVHGEDEFMGEEEESDDQ